LQDQRNVKVEEIHIAFESCLYQNGRSSRWSTSYQLTSWTF